MTAALFDQFAASISELTLIPSKGGRFEVMVDEMMIYSKHATGRHAQAGEIEELIAALNQA